MTRVIIEVNNLQDNDLVGKMAISKAGRDKGNYYIVIKQIDDNYVFVADGKLKTIEKPKRKKLKHLNISVEVASEIKEAIISNDNNVDIIIKKFLKGKAIV